MGVSKLLWHTRMIHASLSKPATPDPYAALPVQASYIGDSCCTAVGNGDLVLISAGSSYHATVNTVAVQARQAGLHSLISVIVFKSLCLNTVQAGLPHHTTVWLP